MGLFDLFKKTPAARGELTLMNLRKKDVLDYFLKSWIVKNFTDYDWGNEHFSREYEIDSGDEQYFLSVDNFHGMEVTLSRMLKLGDIEGNIKQHIFDHDKPPAQLVLKGTVYIFSGEYMAECQDAGETEWTKLVNWMYVDKAEENFISIDRWGEGDITAALGKYVEPHEFSNFLPGS